ncbi:MAG: beta-lactamase protein [Phycisphaerales bacterium]|nr:beta-lactamase protein [Phycisphaerales bacterium]
MVHDIASLASAFAQFQPVTEGVHRLTTLFVNLYAVDVPGGFVLVDTGLPAGAWYVRKALDTHYGVGAKPVAIVLTHAHFDHSGSAKALAEAFDVPVYVHEQEQPYVNGQSDYPPQDPTPGGAICFMARFFPRGGIDLGDRVQILPADGTVPPLPGWTWHHTPGHTAGHVSFFREAGGVLIAGDAVATLDLDAWSSQLTWPREIARPATPFTPDWTAARESIHKLADLKPQVLAAGHGLPMHDPEMEHALRTFAKAMQEPDGGRYAGKPAVYDASGAVERVPPPVADPMLTNIVIGAVAVGAIAGATLAITAATRQRREG